VTIDAAAMAPAVRAAALTDFNGLYSEAGRHGDALRVAQEALVAIKPAAENDPGATMPTLVACASNLARCLRTRGRARDAVGVLEAMAENCRSLEDGAWVHHLPTMAGLLDDLAVYQFEAGYPERAQSRQPPRRLRDIVGLPTMTRRVTFQGWRTRSTTLAAIATRLAATRMRCPSCRRHTVLRCDWPPNMHGPNIFGCTPKS
jgi:hypothetical protein